MLEKPITATCAFMLSRHDNTYYKVTENGNRTNLAGRKKEQKLISGHSHLLSSHKTQSNGSVKIGQDSISHQLATEQLGFFYRLQR